MELQGQSVVVSGGASGLGAETVRHQTELSTGAQAS
jgi:NAD(P)-dependent dehydrogenase (short-subunit alcohol dehydrogenase family)